MTTGMYKSIFEKTIDEAAQPMEAAPSADAETFAGGFENPDDASQIDKELKQLEGGESQAVSFVKKANEYYKFILEMVIPKLKHLDKEIATLIPKGLVLDTPDITKVNISLYSLAEQLVGAVQKAVNQENIDKLPETK